jgi:hypothetical protein
LRTGIQKPEAACAAGELPRGVGRAPHNLGDFLEGQIEHIVQDESEALGGNEAVKYHEQSDADRICEERFTFGSFPAWRLATGSETRSSIDSSRREVRERSMSSHTRATTVVSHPPRFSMALVSERLTRSQIS